MFVLIASVQLVDTTFLIFDNSNKLTSFSWKEITLGIISDFTRSILLCYLFPQLIFAGKSIVQAIKFGLTISALISTLWLIFGYFQLKLINPNTFLIYDGLIFIIQGILSGLCLHYLFLKKLIH